MLIENEHKNEKWEMKFGDNEKIFFLRVKMKTRNEDLDASHVYVCVSVIIYIYLFIYRLISVEPKLIFVDQMLKKECIFILNGSKTEKTRHAGCSGVQNLLSSVLVANFSYTVVKP